MLVVAPRVDIAANLARVIESIERISLRRGRRREDVTLVAVSKTQPADVMQRAIEAGVRHFGENRVQETADKIDLIASSNQVAWHLIGTLQTNKIGRALDLFDMIHSVDSERLALELSKRLSPDRRFPILLQVNVAREATKHGLTVDESPDVARRVARLPGLSLQGLMAIAPLNADPEASRPWFRALRLLKERLADDVPDGDWRHLSMGMSHDYEVAIEEGATLVRVGSAIFGPRS